MPAECFRLLDDAADAAGDAAWNMSVDEALLCLALDAGPTLRLYDWRAPAVSLGYRQAVPAWLPRCDALGVETVRRVSGGGTVLHAGDLTYAVIAPRGSSLLPDDLAGSYEWIRETLVEGLRRAGLGARRSPPVDGAERLELCFAGATGYEVELDGRKLVGSAQRRTGWGLLQHGSIRLRDDSALYEALVGEAPGAKPPALLSSASDLRQGLIEAFRDRLGGRLEPASFHISERQLASERVAERRQESLWSPPLSLRRFPRSADRLP